MRNYRLFLAYYTFFASLTIFAWSIFFGPKPQSLLLAILFVPIGLYFWLIFSHPPQIETEEHTKIPLFILAALLISAVSLLASNTTRPDQKEALAKLSAQVDSLHQELAKINPPVAGPDASTAAQLRALKNDIINLKAASNGANLLGDETTQAGIITTKDKSQSVNVYQEKNLSGKIIGKLEMGKTYPFIDKSADWYLVLLAGQQGYVASSLVKEANN